MSVEGISQTVRVAVVDDHDVVHAGIDAWFAQSDPPIAVVFTATDAASAAPAHLDRAGPVDVVVLDLYLGQGRPDLVLLRDLVATGHRVVVFSGTTDPGVVLDCLDLGASAFLTKAEGRAHLQAAVLEAAEDRGYIGPVAAGAMADDRRVRRPRLSPREREVLLSWFRTESKELVAASLHITTATVNTHLARIRAKYAEAGRPGRHRHGGRARVLTGCRAPAGSGSGRRPGRSCPPCNDLPTIDRTEAASDGVSVVRTTGDRNGRGDDPETR